MPRLHQPPPGGKGGDPPAAPSPLDPADAAAFQAWLADLGTQVDDLAAAAEDATRPPGRRMLGRAGARRIILEARRAVGDLLAAARAGAAG